MKAIIEQTDASGKFIGTSVAMRWVESPDIYTQDEDEGAGPIALSTRGNAHVFESFASAGKWVDANSELGTFSIHAAVTS